VERPPVGLGPGTWLISLFCSNVGGSPVPTGFAWCTANFVFQNGSSFGLGTAGHCAAKGALGSPVTAIVTPPPEVCANGGSYAPAVMAHCGNGAAVGTGDTCRTSAGLFAASTWYAWYGASTPGDSGSGVEILGNYAAPLNAVPAAADLTHIIILDARVSRNGQ